MFGYASGLKNLRFIIDNEFVNFELSKLHIKNQYGFLPMEDIKRNGNIVDISLREEINIKLESFFIYENYSLKVNYFPMFKTDEFNLRYFFPGELGVIYSSEGSTFSVWSPAAASVTLLLYRNGDPLIQEEPERYTMDEHNGLFRYNIPRDLKGYFYIYEIDVYGHLNLAADPYAKAVGINGHRGAIIDLKDTDPDEWQKDMTFGVLKNTDAIIYETSIRDISSHPDSGIENKGKFLGLAEEETKSSKGLNTGLAHLKEMGMTHIQLMPFYDFSYKSVDEKNPILYNWGYDPQNYNVPEGSYSTNPYDPTCRIRELKTMILTLHKNGFRINMDVVYNHLYHATDNNFEKIFPGYYLRRNLDGSFSNGSGCSNDTASENQMMRKFIFDSITYWAKEYHLDGFRVDLMGLHDIDTINYIRDGLNHIKKNIMLYGEGWELDTALSPEIKAAKYNANKTTGVGYFNDVIRDTVKGSVFNLKDKGFANGKSALEDILKKSILGTRDIFVSPEQSINYASCHDNSTLWDKFEASNKDDSIEERKRMTKLVNAIILTSQGVPFLHSGEEFCRTKLGEQDSVKSPDNVNWLDWNRKLEFIDVVDYYKGLIKIRNLHPAFRMDSFDEIEKNIEFLSNTPENLVGFIIKNHANQDSWRNILVIYNANKTPVWLNIPNAQWYLAADDVIAGIEPIKMIDTPRIDIPPLSMYLMYCL